MKNNKLKNYHPSKEICEKCSDHGICLAEKGLENYICTKEKENER